MNAPAPVTLSPISNDPSTDWASALWIGALQDEPRPSQRLHLAGGESFATARLLVRHGSVPRGFVELPIHDGHLDGDELGAAVDALPRPTDLPYVPAWPAITVIVCTRSRPDQLTSALASLTAIDYPGEWELLVVDNGPSDLRTRAAAEAFDTPFGTGPVRVVDAPVPGLSRARNVGLRAARNDIVAFTDDDVQVDPGWLTGVAYGFARAAGVACVCGIVPSIEVASLSQWYFDRRVSWASSVTGAVLHITDERPDEPLFPFQVGRYGTGANFAVDRRAVRAAGGFDEGLGVGTPTGGGEDIDMFVRLILAGHRLVYEPTSVVWHKHRADDASLLKQMSDYGMGLGAWLTKLALQPRVALMVARRAVPALLHLNRVTVVAADDGDELIDPKLLAEISKTERRGVLRGPAALLRARRGGGRSRPMS